MDQLKNYQTVQKEGNNSVVSENSAKDAHNSEDSHYNLNLKNIERWTAENLNEHPLVQKSMIPLGMKYYAKKAQNSQIEDALALWDAAANDFRNSGNYIKKNGYLVDSISELPPEFQDIVQAKVRQQLHVPDAKGLILKPDSSLAKCIAVSPEFKSFIKDIVLNNYQNGFLYGNTISGSTSFTSSQNLAYALGLADIINTYIDSNGNIVSYILDTYDFNPKDLRDSVKIAYNVQRNGLLTNYYTITKVVIPREEWMLWLKPTK